MRIFLLFVFINMYTSLNAQITSDNEPTLAETLDWLRNKINDYCKPGDGTWYPSDRNDIDYYDGNISVSPSYVLTAEGEKATYDYMLQTLSLYNVTRYDVRSGAIYLYSKGKAVHVLKKHRELFQDNYEITEENRTFFVLRVVDSNAEENLLRRFYKALDRLVVLNNASQPKEAF